MKFQRIVAVTSAASLITQVSFAAPPPNVNQAITEIQSDSALISGWFADQLKVAAPFNSTSGDVVPQQIKLFGFELGVAGVASSTQMDINALRSLPTSVINPSTIDSFSRLPMPDVMGQVKVGLPFGWDAGLRYGGIPSTDLNEGSTHLNLKNSIFGLDVRKVLIEEGLINPFGLTVGANFTHATGSLGVTQPYTSNGTVVQNGAAYTSALNATGTGNTDWNTKSVGVQAILDKTFFFFTPYVGAAANKNFGTVNSAITTTGTETLTDPSDSANTASQAFSTTGGASATPNLWDLRLLAGFELTPFPFFRFGFYGEYAGDRNLAGSLGLRFQFH